MSPGSGSGNARFAASLLPAPAATDRDAALWSSSSWSASWPGSWPASRRASSRSCRSCWSPGPASRPPPPRPRAPRRRPRAPEPPASTKPTPARLPRAGLARSLAVIGGLVVSFSIIVLAGSEILSLLHLPQDALRDAGIVLLAVVGLGYLIPPLGALIERPFARVGTRQPSGRAGGFVLGLALGVLFVPCAGPVLAAITVVGATHRVGPDRGHPHRRVRGRGRGPAARGRRGGRPAHRAGRRLRRRAPRIRQVGGVVLVVMALAIAFNVFAGLQRDVPGYTTALQGSRRSASSSARSPARRTPRWPTATPPPPA